MQDHKINETRAWIEKVVIGQNFCPFAKKEFVKNGLRFIVKDEDDIGVWLDTLHQECQFLKENPAVSSSFLIFPTGLEYLEDYLDTLSIVENYLFESGLEGVFQVASFHPKYQFAGLEPDDFGNYTNRSPYPMWHILREDEVEHAVATHPNIDGVPIRNRAHARKLGAAFFN